MVSLDYVLVGGGLQNALVAAALVQQNRAARVAIIEAAPRLGGNHLWCFHALDVPAAAAPFVEPFVVQRWPRYRVRFPEYSRTIDEPYAAVTSLALHEHMVALAASSALELRLGVPARSIGPGRVELASGEVVTGRVVIDARGPERFGESGALGFQKFVGLELKVRPESAPREPMLMDCSVEQVDGLRFMYVLPLAPDRVLVEDTYFSDAPGLDDGALEREILGYAARIGLVVDSVLRRERGVLPLPAAPPLGVESAPGLIGGGYQGGWFHPTTGYSFPLAVRLASTIASASLAELPERVAELAVRTRRQQRFATLLNRMLFRGFAPEHRYGAFERFYRLPPDTVRRFYALSLTPADRARIVCGRPPRGITARGLLSALAPASAPSHPEPGTSP